MYLTEPMQKNTWSVLNTRGIINTSVKRKRGATTTHAEKCKQMLKAQHLRPEARLIERASDLTGCNHFAVNIND